MRKTITQIGSLPYEDVDEALDYSFRHDIPFLPELIKKGDSMLEYIKHPGKLSCLEKFKSEVKRRKISEVKIQCVGPSTLIFSEYEKDDAVNRIKNHVNSILEGLSAEKVILFFDEPLISLDKSLYEALEINEGYSQILDEILNGIPKRDLTIGMHTCNRADWNGLFGLSKIEIISFDASKFAREVFHSEKYRGNKRIAWGINRKEDAREFHEGDLLTLPCGMSPARYSIEDCEKNLAMLSETSRFYQNN